MVRVKPHHFRNQRPLFFSDEISIGDDGFSEDSPATEIVDGGGDLYSPARSLSDPDINGTPQSPSISGFIIKPVRSGDSGEDSAVKLKKSSERLSPKRLAEAEQGGGELKKKKKKESSFSVTSASLTPATGGEEKEVRKSSGANHRVWSEEDEIALLEGVIEFTDSNGYGPGADAYLFSVFMKDRIHVEASKAQLLRKVSHLNRKYRRNLEKMEKGIALAFTNSHKSIAFELSKKIWGFEIESNKETPTHYNSSGDNKEAKQAGSNKNTGDSVVPDMGCREPLVLELSKQECIAKKNLETGNSEAKNGIEVEPPKQKGNFEVLIHAAEAIEASARSNLEAAGDGNEVGIKKGGNSRSENPYLVDALEKMVAARMIGELEKRQLLEKDGVFPEGNEWEDEWKALRFEEMELGCKKLELLTKFAEIAWDKLKNDFI